VYLRNGKFVLKVPVEGGAVTTLAYSSGVDSMGRGAFAVDDTHVYWVVYDGSWPELHSIVRVSKD
jgi:hypothetical protein